MEDHRSEDPPDDPEPAHGGFAASLSPRGRLRGRAPRHLVAAIKELSGRRVTILEIGAGSGILTGPLIRAGCSIVAVEADPMSATQLRRSLPQAPVVVAEPRRLPVCDASVGLVVVDWHVPEVDVVHLSGELRRVMADPATLVLLRRPDGAAFIEDQEWLRPAGPERSFGDVDGELALTMSTFRTVRSSLQQVVRPGSRRSTS